MCYMLGAQITYTIFILEIFNLMMVGDEKQPTVILHIMSNNILGYVWRGQWKYRSKNLARVFSEEMKLPLTPKG